MLWREDCCGCQTAIASKLAPTLFLHTQIIVGASLLAMGPLKTPNHLPGLTVTGALPDFICSSNGAH